MAADEPNDAPRPLYTRLLWFIALWFAGVLVIGAFALLVRRLLL